MKTIFIMGCPRSGKTTLAKMIAKKFGYQVVHEDAVRGAFKVVFPEMNINATTAEQSEDFHRFLQEYLAKNIRIANGEFGYVFEGCDTRLDKFFRFLKQPDCLAYYLGLCDISSDELLRKIRENETEYDWTKKSSDENLMEDIVDFIRCSNQDREDCKKNSVPFYNTIENRELIYKEILEDIEKKIK